MFCFAQFQFDVTKKVIKNTYLSKDGFGLPSMVLMKARHKTSVSK